MNDDADAANCIRNSRLKRLRLGNCSVPESACVGGPEPAETVSTAQSGLAATAWRSGSSEQARFHALVMPHLSAAYRLARYLIGDPHAAEDITQDALLSAFRGLDGLRGEAAKPWLMAIVRNACLAYRRRNRGWAKRAVSGMDDYTNVVADPDAENPEGSAIRQGELTMLRAAIRALPEPLREALVLRELGEHSYKEIAEITAVPIGTVMSRLARGRAELSVAWRRLEDRTDDRAQA